MIRVDILMKNINKAIKNHTKRNSSNPPPPPLTHTTHQGGALPHSTKTQISPIQTYLSPNCCPNFKPLYQTNPSSINPTITKVIKTPHIKTRPLSYYHC